MFQGEAAPWYFDPFLRVFDKLAALVAMYCLFEQEVQIQIEGWINRKSDWFQSNGRLGCNMTPNFSSCKGQILPYPQLTGEDRSSFQSLGEEEKFQHLWRQKVLLGRLHDLLENDLDRLWKRVHDGKSSRHFQPFHTHPSDCEHEKGKPWYFGSGGNLGIWRAISDDDHQRAWSTDERTRYTFWDKEEPTPNWDIYKMSQFECRFCILNRWLVELECKLDLLEELKRRLRSAPWEARGASNARMVMADRAHVAAVDAWKSSNPNWQEWGSDDSSASSAHPPKGPSHGDFINFCK